MKEFHLDILYSLVVSQELAEEILHLFLCERVAVRVPAELERLDDVALDADVAPGVHLEQRALHRHRLQVHHGGEGGDVLIATASRVQ